MRPIDVFWRAVHHHPEAPAVLGPGVTMTFRQLAKAVEQRALLIAEAAPGEGVMVALGAANGVEHLVALLGILAAGNVWIPLNPRSGDPEIARQIAFVDPELLLLDEAMTERLPSQAHRTLPVRGDTRERSGRVAMGPHGRLAVALDRTQAIKFTGGTTGVPKGVMQPLRAWNAVIVAQQAAWGLTPRDRYLVAAPITHGTSTYILPVLGAGGALVFPEASEAGALLDAVAAHDVSLSFAPPTLIQALVAEQARQPRTIGALRNLIYGGAPMRVDQILEAQACFGPVVGASYGQTEVPQIAAFLPPHEMSGNALRSVGGPGLRTQITIIDADGRPCASGCDGEVVLAGDLVMTGYYNLPEATAAAMSPYGLRTGDIGHVDDCGRLFLKDRLRDIIITGGFNVYPGDVESVLLERPEIVECAVIGVPDPKWGEAVQAVVRLRPGTALNMLELKTLIRHALGPVKVPKAIHIWDALPLTPVGKVNKTAIRQRLIDDGEPA